MLINQCSKSNLWQHYLPLSEAVEQNEAIFESPGSAAAFWHHPAEVLKNVMLVWFSCPRVSCTSSSVCWKATVILYLAQCYFYSGNNRSNISVSFNRVELWK